MHLPQFRRTVMPGKAGAAAFAALGTLRQNWLGAELPSSGRQVYLLILVAFGGLVSVTWVSELLNPVNLILGLPAGEANYAEAWVETMWTLLVMLLLLIGTRILLVRLRYLEGLLRMCSFCKSISMDGQWVPFEHYLQQNSRLMLSHSLCPDCACKHYGYSVADQAADAAGPPPSPLP